MNKKLNILFIKEDKSLLDSDSKIFSELFNSVDKAQTEQEAQILIDTNEYDIVINDASVNITDGTAFMKQIQEKKPKQVIVALASLQDENKLAELVDLGIHAFLLSPEQFEQALEAIARIDTF